MLSLAFSRLPLSPISPFATTTSKNPIPPFQGKPSSLILGNNTPNPVVSLAKFHKVLALAATIGDENQYRTQDREEEKETEESTAVLREGLNQELMPKHIAIMIDGHRRWAKEKNLPYEVGQVACRKPLEQLISLCLELEIKVLSVQTFATANWHRPKKEVDFLLKLYEEGMKVVTKQFMRDDIRISVIGNRATFPESLQEAIALAEETTKGNKRLHILSAMDYNGRSDITQACKTLADKVKDGLLQPEDIDENLFQQQLQTNCSEYPNPDLLIRTSGVNRLGNFMLWQLAYSEIFFVEKYNPDMREADFVKILSDFQKRRRRFGK